MDRVAFTLFGKDIYWYGIIIACGLLIGVFLAIREAKRRGYRAEMILDFLLIAIPLSIVSARLYYVIFQWPMYAADPLKIFAIWEGGLAIYGAVIGGIIAAIIFYKWRRVPVGQMLDIAAPSLIIGQAIGRWGNFVNQEAHGARILNPDWQWFPAGVQIEGIWYQATFFYESLWNFIVFAILMLVRKKVKIRGGIFAMYVLLYGFGRFWIESMRTDSLMFNNIRISQALSLLLFVCGIAYLVIMSRRKKEYLDYDGLYSLDWSEAQVDEYKANIKKIRAEENAERATRKAEALLTKKDIANNKVKKAEDKAEKIDMRVKKAEEVALEKSLQAKRADINAQDAKNKVVDNDNDKNNIGKE